MQIERVRQIVCAWDPIHLFPGAPSDEYDYEVQQIFNELNTNMSISKMGTEILRIFSNSFGNTFQCGLSECEKVASELIE